MSRRFRRGLVVGKFSPLHRGHELVVRTALERCDEVVVVSYAKPERVGCEADKREAWLAARFPTTTRLVATDDMFRARVGPNGAFTAVPSDDADETTHRRFCAFLCREVLGVVVDAVFTSETYGGPFAAELTRVFRASTPDAPAVAHVEVDGARRIAPISGTAIRRDVHAFREWLAPEVYASFVRRVCFLGGESSGKSTLAEACASAGKTAFVPEYGRDLWEKRSGALTFDDMLHIAETQVAREEAATLSADRYVFCDTSPLTTRFYSEEMFGRVDPALERLAARPYDLVVVCAPDFPFHQDGTRREAGFRERQHAWYLAELARRGVEHHVVGGPLLSRVDEVFRLAEAASRSR